MEEMESMNMLPGFEQEVLRVDWAQAWGREKVHLLLYGGELMGGKLLLRSLDAVEGEVGFDDM